MPEKPEELKIEKLDGASLEKSLEEILRIKIGAETSLLKIKEILNSDINRYPLKFIITADYDIWLSDQTHFDILNSNGLSAWTPTFHAITGYCRLQDNPPVVYFYERNNGFDSVFRELKEVSNMANNEFNDVCKKIARKKILDFLFSIK